MNPKLTRRAFLGGAGVTLALPMLESLLPRGAARAGGMEPPRRMLAFFVPNGMPMAAWTPASEGEGFALSPILSPLQELRSEVLVLSGLANRAAERVYRGSDDGAGDHARGTGAFLTSARLLKTAGTNLRNGVSADQVVAAAVGAATRFPSLQIGISGGSVVGDCDAGYSCAYTANISWSGPARPLARLTSPQAVFDRLFGGLDLEGTPQEQARRRAFRTSVLDHVHRDAARLSSRLGASDRSKLDEYLTSVREVERRVADATPLPSACAIPAPPPNMADYPTRVRLMCDLMVLAFRCDITRVISFMLGNSGGNQGYDFLGVPSGHHDISHHQNDPEKIRQRQVIGTWEVAQLAHLLRAMREARELDGSTLLDRSTVLFSSELSDGNNHTHDDLPVLLAGRCGGRFATGRHVRYASERPIANLHIAMMRSMGASVERFGEDGTGALEGLGPVSG